MITDVNESICSGIYVIGVNIRRYVLSKLLKVQFTLKYFTQKMRSELVKRTSSNMLGTCSKIGVTVLPVHFFRSGVSECWQYF